MSHNQNFGAFCERLLGLNDVLAMNGFSIKPLKVKLLAGEQKATEKAQLFFLFSSKKIPSESLHLDVEPG